ncbi:hypothetical protein P389DRAFT_24643 [Cystobasidium minutum MCA 4210]|uniref:uncharacterized protein n=1 Tax=Cystobasidium minutum MCA 4210 TaxID=1397322 RepID=UPI0034CE5E1C|eukprot:jgi/Rhomi1/24643/CE24642_773
MLASPSAGDAEDTLSILCAHYYAIEMLHSDGVSANVRLSLAYAQLGETYITYAKSLPGKPARSEKTQAEQTFKALCREATLSRYFSTDTAREAWRKRLERGRKFASIVQWLGKGALYTYPEVCVTRVDKLSLKQIAYMGTSHELIAIQIRIRAKLEGLAQTLNPGVTGSMDIDSDTLGLVDPVLLK